MESFDMEISSATEEEEDDDEAELNKLLNSLSGMEKCLVPVDDESDDVAVIEPDIENEANNNVVAEGSRTKTRVKTRDGSKQEKENLDSVIALSPLSSNASTLSRGSTPRRQITDCDIDAQSAIPQVSIAQLLDRDSDNDVILDSINEYRKNLETESGSDHSDICFLGVGTAEVDSANAKSKQTSTLPDNPGSNSKSDDSIVFDGAVSGSSRNTVALPVVPPTQTHPQESEKTSSFKEEDGSDSDCLIVEHIAASDHRQNGLIDLTKPENAEGAPQPLENRTEESLLKEISQIRKALMQHSTKKHKKHKKHKRHKSRSSSKKKKKSKSRTQSPSVEKVADKEDEIADESRVITLTESGKLSVNVLNQRSRWDTSESDDSSKTTKSKEKNDDSSKSSKSKDKEIAATAKTSKSAVKETVDSSITALSTEIQNADSSTADCSTTTQSVNPDSTEITKTKDKENTVNNCNKESASKANPPKVNEPVTRESPKVAEPEDKADSDDSPLWNSDAENMPDFNEKSNVTRTEFNENSNLTRSDFNDTSRVTVLTFGINKNSSSFDSNPLRRKSPYNPDQNNFDDNPPQKRIFCDSGKEMQSNFRRRGGPRGFRGRGSRRKQYGAPGNIGSYLFRKSDGSDSEPENPQQSMQSAPFADRFNRFGSDSDSEKSTKGRSKSVSRYQGVINWKTASDHSVPDFKRGRGRSRPVLKSPPPYVLQHLRRSPSPAPNLRRSLSRSPTCYPSRNLSSCRSPSPFSYRSKSSLRSKTPSITHESYYRASVSRSRSPDERTFRSKSRSHRSKSRALRSPSHPRSHRSKSRALRSPSRPRSHRSKSRALRSPSRSRRSKSHAYRSPSVSSESPSRTRRSKSRAYRSPSRSRRSKSRVYRSPSRSHRSKSRAYRSPSRSGRSKSRKRESCQKSSSSSDSSRSPSLTRAARACSPLEEMRQQLKKKNEAAVLRALGGLQKPKKGRANLKACKARVIDDVDLTTSSPSPDTCMPAEINVLNRNARTASAITQATSMHSNNATVSSRNHHIVPLPMPNLPLTGFGPQPQPQPIRMQHPGYMPMAYPMMHNPSVMNQMIQISHVFSRAVGPPDRPLGPPDRPLGPPDRPLGPPDRPLGPPDRPLGPPDRPLGPPDGPLGSPGEPLGPPGEPFESPEAPLGPPDRPLGLANRTLVGPPERPLGPPEGTLGPSERRLASPECYMPLHYYLQSPYM